MLLDTTVEHGFRAWEQAQMLLDEASDVRAGDGVGHLDDFAAGKEEPAESAVPSPAPTTPAAPASAEAAAESSSFEGSQGWIGWMVAGLVALLVVVVATFSLLRR